MSTKVCNKCKVEKSLDQYHNTKSNADGKAGKCKACIKAYQKEYRKKNRDILREKDRKRRNTPEAKARRKEWNKQYREENKEQLKAKKKEYYDKNRDSILAKKKEQYVPAVKPKLNIYSNGVLTIKSPTHGDHTVLYDPEDEQLLKQHKWHLHRCGENGQKKRAFYARAHIPCPSGEWTVWGGVNRRKLTNLFMHRLVNNTPEGKVTDHINGNTLDNRKVNLDSASLSENGYNRGKMTNNTSGYIGVTWDKYAKRWQAAVAGTVSEVQTTLWSTNFDDIIEAAVARDQALCSLIDIASPERQLNFPERYEEYMAGKDKWLEEFEKKKAARAMARRNNLGLKGVRPSGKNLSHPNSCESYSARITLFHKEIYLGVHPTPEVAGEAWDRKACEIRDNIRPKDLNFPERYEEYMADLKNTRKKILEP